MLPTILQKFALFLSFFHSGLPMMLCQEAYTRRKTGVMPIFSPQTTIANFYFGRID